ncbi:MAG: alpha/beta fold hydrolase [Saprospiraceae bacterium]|nr:alpha/beta fold hydrolase [Saprospiraceae bacterium]
MKKAIFGLLFAAASILLYSACSDKDDTTPSGKTYVLVHGSFQGAYAWQFLQPKLEAQGHKVVVVELQAHGNDNTPPSQASITAYRDKVISAIEGLQGKVILVGHSMGGMVISIVAEKIPTRIEKLVYIAGFVPLNGQSLFDLASQDHQSLLGPALMPSADMLTFSLTDASVPPIFCQDGSTAIKQMLIDENRPEPAIPFTQAVSVTSGAFGSVSKYYIRTTLDNTVGIDLQDQMLAAGNITNIYTIVSGHCPFLTQPDVVTDILLNKIK